MALLDVSVALTNPYTLDRFTVFHRLQVINEFGEAKMQWYPHQNVRGVVYPDGDEKLRRRAEAQVAAKTLTVFTRFPVRGESELVDGTNFEPDVVLWGGNYFLVTDVSDWSKYARGFVKVSAASIDIVDMPPQLAPPIPAPLFIPGTPSYQIYVPPTAVPIRYDFVGDGHTKTFTFPSITGALILLWWNGLLQTVLEDYIATTNSVSFALTPQSGDPVTVVAIPGAVRYDFVASGSSNVFTLPSMPSGLVLVAWDGVLQTSPRDYGLSGATLTMVLTPEVGDPVAVIVV